MCKNILKKQIKSEQGPQSAGPYSMGIVISPHNSIYLSGQLPSNVEDSIKKQTIQVIENIEFLLEEAGSCLQNVIKTTIYLTDMEDFNAVNQVYAIYFSHPYPARSCVAVSALPKGARIQIECVASVGGIVSVDEDEECLECDE